MGRESGIIVLGKGNSINRNQKEGALFEDLEVQNAWGVVNAWGVFFTMIPRRIKVE